MIIDIILIAIIVIGCYLGYKKGLTKILIRLIGLVIALVVAFSFKGVVADFLIQTTGVNETMKQTIVDGLNQESNQGHEVNNEENFYTMIIKNLGLNQGVETLADHIIRFIFETISFIIILIVALVIVWIIQSLADLVVSLPILDTINSIGGIIAGGILTFLKIFIVFAVFQMLTPVIPQIQNTINTTTVTKQLYYNNIVTDILSASLR